MSYFETEGFEWPNGDSTAFVLIWEFVLEMKNLESETFTSQELSKS